MEWGRLLRLQRQHTRIVPVTVHSSLNQKGTKSHFITERTTVNTTPGISLQVPHLTEGTKIQMPPLRSLADARDLSDLNINLNPSVCPAAETSGPRTHKGLSTQSTSRTRIRHHSEKNKILSMLSDRAFPPPVCLPLPRYPLPTLSSEPTQSVPRCFYPSG